ncbi:hypothetical protein AHEV_098 [Adoxophyes honmai entomopoxvirus 'L']|uniref:Uncharacterized protein n=1 Tax=Adoxophyes honmai entomopoxvirus 'L' TaxID=1293540 RepID=A0A916KP22_9POXV|nr:hypothetical protein AHEV_098 [Adoxophyes honmai entomopoxvirus 'L']CCU55419.1 hypothetical protein AHEV_098 [Adoxophyes honmai entomopoxvirus 'L']
MLYVTSYIYSINKYFILFYFSLFNLMNNNIIIIMPIFISVEDNPSDEDNIDYNNTESSNNILNNIMNNINENIDFKELLMCENKN